jgi:hypothetical protein
LPAVDNGSREDNGKDGLTDEDAVVEAIVAAIRSSRKLSRQLGNSGDF